MKFTYINQRSFEVAPGGARITYDVTVLVVGLDNAINLHVVNSDGDTVGILELTSNEAAILVNGLRGELARVSS